MRLRRKRQETDTSESLPAPEDDRALVIDLGKITLSRDVTMDPLRLREEFHIQLVELANLFDHLDHEVGPMGGTELQDDCQAIRDLTRKEMHHSYRQAYVKRLDEESDAQILAGFVAGPDAG